MNASYINEHMNGNHFIIKKIVDNEKYLKVMLASNEKTSFVEYWCFQIVNIFLREPREIRNKGTISLNERL